MAEMVSYAAVAIFCLIVNLVILSRYKSEAKFINMLYFWFCNLWVPCVIPAAHGVVNTHLMFI